jgi:hypothetical protein
LNDGLDRPSPPLGGPVGQQSDVDPQMSGLAVNRLLSLGQQIHEQRRKTRAHETRRYALIARTWASTAASMREDDGADRVGWAAV